MADLASLHIGDRILEVNGKPVQDHCIEEIENLIANSKEAIHVRMLFVIDRKTDNKILFHCKGNFASYDDVIECVMLLHSHDKLKKILKI